MHEGRPSYTAAYVAVCRGLGRFLPPEARLADDPFGLRCGGPVGRALGHAAEHLGAELFGRAAREQEARFAGVLWLQVRTRALDGVLLDFARAGGTQVVLLGAGYDCRAARFAKELLGATVFEIDHPTTQGRKRELLAELAPESAKVAYLAWDFERRPMRELPAALGALGHDARAPTLVLWEGVTMYLSEEAIDATVHAVRAFSAPGSRFALNYLDRAAFDRPAPWFRVVAGVGEPFRFGWEPSELGAWLAARGFTLTWDRTDVELAHELLPPAYARCFSRGDRHIALALG